MNIDDQKIEEILLRENYVEAEELRKAEEITKTRKITLVEYLLKEGVITKKLLGQAIAESFGVIFADFEIHPPSKEQVLRIPEEFAKNNRVVLYCSQDNKTTIATDQPKQEALLNRLHGIFKEEISFAYAFPDDLDEIFIYYKKPLKTRFDEIILSGIKVAPEIVDQLLQDALSKHASDVHLEPREKNVIIRLRIDGILQQAGTMEKIVYENILNRIKVQAHLRIDEHLSAQDGALRFAVKDGFIDMRISIVPTLNGEKIAIRLLGEYVRSFFLSDIGLSEKSRELISGAYSKPFGMILATGPTGSGKTTTLYAIVKILNQTEVNITTIEDPVEYKIPGVNQIQVNEATNLTFAKGLRSIIRQDPNIILVGEIRDRETAETAVNAALTGHLLFSSFHANDAATAITRLLEIGIEPFLLSSTLELILAQRLVRKICANCRYSKSTRPEELKKIHPGISSYFPAKDFSLYQGKGCKNCASTGYSGRTAIFEIIKITPELRRLILKNPSSQQIAKLARKQGDNSLFKDGVEKVITGITTIRELVRVALPPEKYE